jgi:hypothetical protein
MLWLQRLVPVAPAGQRVEVVDAVSVGPVDGGYNVQVGGCRSGPGDGPPDAEIAAVVRSPADQAEIAAEQQGTGLADGPVADAGDEPPADLSSDVRSAWRLDRHSGHIEAILAAGLVCQTATD